MRKLYVPSKYQRVPGTPGTRKQLLAFMQLSEEGIAIADLLKCTQTNNTKKQLLGRNYHCLGEESVEQNCSL